MRTRALAAVVAALTVVLLTPTAADAVAGPQIVSMSQGWFRCTPQAPFHVVDGPRLGAYGTDRSAAQFSQVVYDFELWPDDDPTAVSTSTYHATLGQPGELHPQSTLTDGATYDWRARMTSTSGTSAWSSTCSFRLDNTNPTAPVVSSPNYPQDTWGAIGAYPRFVFTSGPGAEDVVAYAYSWNAISTQSCGAGDRRCPEPWQGRDSMRSHGVGGPGRLVLPPPGPGPWTLQVVSRDAAGNQSYETTYWVYVPSTEPTVAVTSDCAGTSRLTFTPHAGLSDVVAWDYRLGSETTPIRHTGATADGTGALTVAAEPGDEIWVRSVSASGFRSTWGRFDADPRVQVYSDTYPPGVASGGPGQPGDFTVYGGPVTEYAQFRYRVGTGSAVDVPVGPLPARGEFTWTPDRAGPTTLYVSGLTEAGAWTCDTAYSFRVRR